MNKSVKLLLSIFFVFFYTACYEIIAQVENIKSFTKLYGYVRWFYPSDEVTQVDWDKFAVYGIRKVENAKNENELRQILIDLFEPIAPAIQIQKSSAKTIFDIQLIVPKDTTDLKPISWIHYGVELDKRYETYKSYRINKDSINREFAFKTHDFTYKAPKIGDYIQKDIGNRLTCIMPIVLYGNKELTYPNSDTLLFRQLNYQLSNIRDSTLTIQDKTLQLANVVIAWNVLQHFYPYFDVVKVNWEKELDSTLLNVYSVKTEPEYFNALTKMVVRLSDGHGKVSANIKQWGLPFSVNLVENKIVIDGSMFPDFKIGDIIDSIDDKSALDELRFQESRISGSPQLKRFRGLNMFSADFTKSDAAVKLNRNGEEKVLKCRRYDEYNIYRNQNKHTGEPYNVAAINCGNKIFYLHRYVKDFESVLPVIKDAKGLIVSSDFNLEWDLIPHIIKEPVWSTVWNIPVTMFPDRENVLWMKDRWKIEPKEPFIDAKVVFINVPGRISFGETIMGIIDNYKIAQTVGDTTAGTNGDVNHIYLMGDYQITWTGLKVLKHDSSQLHLIGFKPDYPISRTIKAIKDGRDEYFEKAIEVLKENDKIH